MSGWVFRKKMSWALVHYNYASSLAGEGNSINCSKVAGWCSLIANLPNSHLINGTLALLCLRIDASCCQEDEKGIWSRGPEDSWRWGVGDWWIFWKTWIRCKKWNEIFVIVTASLAVLMFKWKECTRFVYEHADSERCSSHMLYSTEFTLARRRGFRLSWWGKVRERSRWAHILGFLGKFSCFCWWLVM